MCCTLTLNGEIAPQFTNFSLIDQMNQQLDSRADYYGSPLPRVAIAPSHTAPSQWRSSFLVDCTVEICLLLPIFAHLILNDPLRNARGNRGNRHFLTRPAREFFYHESPSIIHIVFITVRCQNWLILSLSVGRLLNLKRHFRRLLRNASSCGTEKAKPRAQIQATCR